MNTYTFMALVGKDGRNFAVELSVVAENLYRAFSIAKLEYAMQFSDFEIFSYSLKLS